MCAPIETVGDVRKRLNVSANTVYKYISASKIRELQSGETED